MVCLIFFSPLVHLFVEGGDVSRTVDTQLSPPFFSYFPPPLLVAAGRCIISIVLNSLLHRHDNLYLSSRLWAAKLWPCGALIALSI